MAENTGSTEHQDLPPEAQAAALRELLNNGGTLDEVAAAHPQLAAGVELVREGGQRAGRSGSGSAPFAYVPLADA